MFNSKYYNVNFSFQLRSEPARDCKPYCVNGIQSATRVIEVAMT